MVNSDGSSLELWNSCTGLPEDNYTETNGEQH